MIAALIGLGLFFVLEVMHHTADDPDHLSAIWRAVWLFAVCVCLYVGAILHQKRCPASGMLRAVTLLSLGLYLYLLINFTLLDAALGRLGESVYLGDGDRRRYYMEHFVNWTPLRSIWQVYIKGFWNGYVHAYYVTLNLLGNLAALTPLALLLPALFRMQRRWYVFLATMVGVVVLIESLQLILMVGSCDVDDLILNAGGAMLAYAILKIPPVGRKMERVYCATE